MAKKAKDEAKKEASKESKKAKDEAKKEAGSIAPSLKEAKENGYEPTKYNWTSVKEGKELDGDFVLSTQRIATWGVVIPNDSLVQVVKDGELIRPYEIGQETIYSIQKSDKARFSDKIFDKVSNVKDTMKKRYLERTGKKSNQLAKDEWLG